MAWTKSVQQMYSTKDTFFEQIAPETSAIRDRLHAPADGQMRYVGGGHFFMRLTLGGDE